MRVLVYATSELTARAGSVLAGMPEVDEVAAFPGAPHRTTLPVAIDPNVFDLVVSDASFEVASQVSELSLVLPGGSGPTSRTVLTDCSLRGLAIALAKWQGAEAATYTTTAEVHGPKLEFPAPVGSVPTRALGEMAGIHLSEAGAGGRWGGVRVETRPPLAMVDDRAFMEAIALAAGVVLVARLPGGIFGPWEDPEPYVRAALGAGLVGATL